MILLTHMLLVAAAMNESQTSTLSPILETFLKQKAPLPCSNNVPVAELRQQFNERQKSFNQSLPEYNLSIENGVAKTAEGDIPLRIYRPEGEALLPALVFMHGGGFVFGDLDTLEGYCREIAHRAHCIVLSVDYPLAPEHPFPAAPQSCYAATCWIQEHLSQWGGDPQRLFIGGSSAGATLAASVCQMIRDQGGPEIAGQILLCPMMDANFETRSYQENSKGYGLTREQCRWFLARYAAKPSDYVNPLMLPLRASSFNALPRALMVTAEFDPVRDDGRAYAQKLKQAGIACEDLCYKGMIHGFYILTVDLPEKEEVLNQMRLFLN